MSSTPTHYESGEEIPPGIRAILDMLTKKIDEQAETNRALNDRLNTLSTPQNTPDPQMGSGDMTASESARQAASAAQTSRALPPGVRLDFSGIQVTQGTDQSPGTSFQLGGTASEVAPEVTIDPSGLPPPPPGGAPSGSFPTNAGPRPSATYRMFTPQRFGRMNQTRHSPVGATAVTPTRTGPRLFHRGEPIMTELD